jgi:phospholipid-binding lipoprotein MlaA
MRHLTAWFLIVALSIVFSTPVVAEDEFTEFVDSDPWRGVNQKVHNFNDFADVELVRPVALGYRRITPGFFRTGVSNVFSNLDDVGDAINNGLQGKVGDGISDVTRVLINSTIGLAGLFDPATPLGLVDHEEDWGQTFAVWGVPAGPYFVIPGLGPSTVRDTASRFFDGAVNPLRYLYPVRHRNTLFALRALQDRTDLLSVDGVVFGDKYIFYRDAYLQRREYLEKDGEVDDPFADDF